MEFFDWNKSDYIKRRITLDPSCLSKDYMATRCNLMKKHVIPLLSPTLLLQDVTLRPLEDLQYDFVRLTKLSKQTVNMAMQSVLFALKEAQRRNLLPNTVVLNLQPLKAAPRIRGILSEEEVKRYLAYAKGLDNKRIYLSALLSLCTGMRSGELRALKREQVKESCIVVDRAFADQQGNKMPKGKKTRIVPCPSFVCKELVDFSHTNLFRRRETLVFWSAKTGKEVSSHYFCSLFHQTLEESGILDKESIEKRNITFHSFRHMANTLLRGSVDEYVLRLTIGHSSEQLSDLYTHLSEKAFKSVENAQKQNILPLVENGIGEEKNKDL
jgi:integrase